MKHFATTLTFLAAFALVWLLPSPSEPEPRDRPAPTQESTRTRVSSSRVSTPALVARIASLSNHEDRVRQVIALASSLPLDQIKTWRNQAFLDSLDDDLEFLFSTITSHRWLEADPVAFLTWARENTPLRFYYYLEKSATADFTSTLTFLKSLPGGLHQNTFPLERIFAHLAESNPSLAFKHVTESPFLFQAPPNTRLRILMSLAAAAPQEFARLRQTWPESQRRASAPALASALLKNDFQSGLDFLASEDLGYSTLIDALNHTSSRKTLVSNLDKIPAEWLRMIVDRNSNILTYANDIRIFDYDAEQLNLDESTFEKLLKAGSQSYFPASERPRILEILNNDSLPLGIAQNLLLRQILHWDRDDRRGLENWFDSITLPAVRDQALDLLERNGLPEASSPAIAREPAELIAEHQSPLNAQPGPWSSQQTREAIAAFQQLTREEKNEVFHHPVSASGAFPSRQLGTCPHEFAAAVHHDRLSHPMPDDPATNPEIISFASQWASESPAAAASWAASLPPGPTRDQALGQIAPAWQKYSPTETRNWINSLPSQDQATIRAAFDPSHGN